jgi:hypothetical protein
MGPLRNMRALRIIAFLLAGGAVLLAVLTSFAVLYTLYYIRTPPISALEEPLLSHARVPPSALASMPHWEAAARAHQLTHPDPDLFLKPPLQFGPWTRWWWPGNLVETKELQRELQVFADAGIAGVEIQPFAISVTDSDKASDRWRLQGWDSPEYYRNLHTVLDEAQRLGMGVDLNNGSGWPTGGPHVALEDGLRQLLHSELLVRGPGRLRTRLPAPAMPIATLAAGALGMLGNTPMQTFVPDRRSLVAVVAGRIVENRRSWQPWDFLDQVVLDTHTLQVLTDRVDGDYLDWEIPAGDWAITVLWQLPGGELISGGYAHAQPGYVVDHLDAQRMVANQDYLFRDETGLSKWFGAPLRAFFNDSLEFRQERHWAKGHLDAFEKSIGYDPRPWLPALVEPGKDQMPFHAANIATRPAYQLGESGRRFLEDWDLTTSELFRERYFQPLRTWASERSLAHRLQAYGGPVDIIRAAGESDIPEAEQLYAGGSEMFMKAVSSGAHIHDRPLVSAESFIFLGRAFMTTPAKIKALADKAFVSGINQLVYHGSAYRIERAAERGYPATDGWYPWQLGMLSADYSEYWPFWEHAPQLNRYIARSQYLLQMGYPETDVLVLYPGLGFPQGYSNPLEAFDQGRFEGEESLGLDADSTVAGRGVAAMRALWQATRALEQQGLAWEWVNEHALQSAQYSSGQIRAGKLRAGGLLVRDVEALQPVSAERIAALVADGMPLTIEGKLPSRQRGLQDAAAGDERVRRAMAEATTKVPTTSLQGPLVFQNSEVKFVRRRLANDDLLAFFSNPSAGTAQLNLHIRDSYMQAVWLDAWTGAMEAIEGETPGLASVALPAYGSRVLWVRYGSSDEFPISKRWSPGDSTPVPHWSLSVADVDYESAGPLAGDWLAIPELRSSGGPGVYRARFSAPGDVAERLLRGHRFVLQLGQVFGAATVKLNGKSLGAALLPPFAVDASAALIAGANEIVVEVVPPRKNRLVPAIENREPGWNAVDLVGTSQRVSAGLLGPVTLEERVPILSANM